MPKVVTSSLKWTWWCPSSSTILGVALIKSNFFLEIFSCWNLFPEFLSNRPHITECGKCQNVIWSDWILIWRSCIWKLRSTLKKLFVFPVCLPLLHEGSHPFFSVLCSKRCLQNSGVSKSDHFLCNSRILLFSLTSVDGTIQLRFMANQKKNFERTRICCFHLEHPLLKSQSLLQS